MAELTTTSAPISTSDDEAVYTVRLRNMRRHPYQRAFVKCKAKRIIVKAGRRSGKTTGLALRAVRRFAAGRRQLYAVPTADQMGRFWFEVKRALAEPLEQKALYINETEHIIEVPGTEQRIRAKTAWNADTLRGDYADDLTLDEWQQMDEDAWGYVGAPMLADNNGDAVFAFTPPSLHSRSVSKARDKLHANKMFKRAVADPTGRWKAFKFSSYKNPFISSEGLAEVMKDMTRRAIKQEILVEDDEDDPNGLWKREVIETNRVIKTPQLVRIVIAIDPPITSGGNEAGIIACALGDDGEGYLLRDASLQGSPEEWAAAAVSQYWLLQADRIVAEANQGGEMVERVIRVVDENVAYTAVHASRGKITRAEPIVALYEKGRIHHVGDAGQYQELEEQMCNYVPGDDSPDRMDALVWGFTELMLDAPQEVRRGPSPVAGYRG